ncbi:MAG TPA: NAD(+) diphosphatase [Polyangiaceae bacterium]|nr:NAD(+) diphosphatase [Polyangiaceae bacterium]
MTLPRLDRASHLRKDTDRLMRALDAPGTILVPVWRDKALVTDVGETRAVLPVVATASALVDAAAELVWLGNVGDANCFALDLSDLEEPLTHPALAGAGTLADLRMIGGLLPAEEAELLGYARGLVYWHRRCRFCGVCGHATKPKEGGHVRECETCDAKHFPRTDPAIMALVWKADRCVLARQHGWPKGFYAAVAGFVEPGESVEDGAVREIHEELGLTVTNLRYFRSQPWPFPASLMIGYFAEATSEELVVDHEELEDARWFSRDELRDPKGFAYPPGYSLAHFMIRRFLDGDV